MTFDNSNKSTDYDNKGLVQEYIYRTRDSWRAAFVCATEKLDNGDQGWSVFTIDGHVVSSAMAMIEPQSLSDPSQQRTTVLCLSGAQQRLADDRRRRIRRAARSVGVRQDNLAPHPRRSGDA